MKIAVYCGSISGTHDAYAQAAERLGAWIGVNGHELVFGGGNAGLMGIVARSAHENGAHVTGVVPGDVEFISTRPQPYSDETVVTKDMGERKQVMYTLADAFIALPGGMGTVDEYSEVINLTKIGVFQKKTVLFNADGFYEPFRLMVQKMDESGFLNMRELSHVLVSDSLEEIGGFLTCRQL